MRNTRRPALAAINITPLVDVLLILLVILVLAMPMFVKKMAVELPQTSIAGVPSVVNSLPVELTAQGLLLVEGNPLTLEQLMARIDPTVSVELSADRKVTYEQLTQLIATLQKATPRDIALMTR